MILDSYDLLAAYNAPGGESGETIDENAGVANDKRTDRGQETPQDRHPRPSA